MRPHRVWHRVGPPTWKRSGTLVFTAVMGVLLVGGTAMAANLGLLTSAEPGDRGYRLEVPRPALSVSLPPTSSTSPTTPSTSVSTSVDAAEEDVEDPTTSTHSEESDLDDPDSEDRSDAGESDHDGGDSDDDGDEGDEDDNNGGGRLDDD